MPRLLRRATLALLSLTCLVAAIVADEFAVSHYRRWQVTRLLAVVQQFEPGVTTAAQIEAALKPFESLQSASVNGDTGELGYDLVNSPEWRTHFAPFETNTGLRTGLPLAMFEVDLTIHQSVLSEAHVLLAQQEADRYPHPVAASVRLYAQRFESPFPDTPQGFNGYSSYSQNTRRLDNAGNMSGFSCCSERFITLDERATPTQRRESLNFKFSCFTAWRPCHDDHQMLP